MSTYFLFVLLLFIYFCFLWFDFLVEWVFLFNEFKSRSGAEMKCNVKHSDYSAAMAVMVFTCNSKASFI